MTMPILPALMAFGVPADPPPVEPAVFQQSVQTAPAPFVIVADVSQLNADATISVPGAPTQSAIGASVSEPVDPAVPPDAGATGDDLIVQARQQVPGDPLESINAQTYQVVSKVDEAVIEPVSMAYRDGLPRRVREALSNFFSNLREPVVALNYLLQLKPGKAVETVARFALNSTVGLAGLIDVAEARPFNLPYRRNGFANTMGYYGVGQGPFLVVPLVGATTLRDMIGSGLDQLVMPLAVGRPFTHPAYGPIAYTVNSLDYRIEFDSDIASYRESADPYGAMRNAYLSRRQAEIDALRGRTVAPESNAPAVEAESVVTTNALPNAALVPTSEPAAPVQSASDGPSTETESQPPLPQT